MTFTVTDVQLGMIIALSTGYLGGLEKTSIGMNTTLVNLVVRATIKDFRKQNQHV